MRLELTNLDKQTPLLIHTDDFVIGFSASSAFAQVFFSLKTQDAKR